jgi:uncharacterized SAM-binding protein YcdF (DUF218 family)
VSPELRAHAETLWSFHARGDVLEPMAAIVCLGSYDLRVAERTAELALGHPAAQVVVTGAQGNWTRGVFEQSEAEVFAAVLRERGVSEAQVTLEPKAVNIGENVAFSRDILGYVGGEVVVFVTKPQTQMRVRATVPIHWPQVRAQTASPQLGIDDYARPGEGLTPVIEEMVGDLERMRLYPQRGFQVPVEIAPEVLAAYEALRAAGYDRHCVEPA